MPYRIKHGEAVPRALRRIAREQVDAACKALSGPAQSQDGVHEARKSLKKLRALLRIVRPQLGDTFDSENALLRDLGRRLSPVRDSVALLESFDELRKDGLKRTGKSAQDTVRAALVGEKQRLEGEIAAGHVASAVAGELHAYRDRISKWPIEGDGFEPLLPGAAKIYRAARKGLARVQTDPTPENFHEWRKRTKDLWYLARLLEGIQPEPMSVLANSLHDLEQALGEDHNLTVLAGKLPRGADAFRQALARRQQGLRDSAMAIGKKLYHEKPRQFTDRIETLWRLLR
jgi:CHAD domain-containing protein